MAQEGKTHSPEELLSQVQSNRRLCTIIGIVSGGLALVMPAQSDFKLFFTILFCSSLYHGVFLLWCDDTNPNVLQARYSHYIYHVMMTCFILLFACGDSNTVFVRGVLLHLMPVGFCRTTHSVQQILVFMIAHFAIMVYKSRATLLGEGAQTLAITIFLDALLLDVCRIRYGMGGVNKSLKAATDVFRNMLNFMCDGYLILNKHSDILAMDPKAAYVLVSDVETSENLNFNTFLHPSSNSNVKSIMPGMGSGRLLAADGRDFQIETYTCNCDLLSEGLKWIVEVSNKHYQAKVQAALQCNEDIYLRAIRIISESFNRAPSVASSRKSYNMSDISSLHSVTTYTLEGAGPQDNNSNLHQSLSLGEQVEMTLAVLANPSSSMFATERNNPDFPEILQSMHNSFRTLITDALAQTAEQVQHFLPPGPSQ